MPLSKASLPFSVVEPSIQASALAGIRAAGHQSLARLRDQGESKHYGTLPLQDYNGALRPWEYGPRVKFTAGKADAEMDDKR
jgi:hypothetical protein